jgi:hypothetical protein
VFTANTEKAQIVALIRNQIEQGFTDNPTFVLPHVTVAHELGDRTETTDEELEVQRGTLYTAVLDVLADMNCGLRVERPNGSSTKIRFIVHDGTNRKATIQFSHESGDLDSARYFSSNKSDKNGAYIASPYWGTYWSESGTPSGFNRRLMYIEASDVNINPSEAGAYSFIPAAKVEAILQKRARRRVRARKKTDMLEATVSKSNKYIYREDYDIGDIVFVVGNYDFSNAMRVVEYVETEDDNGQTGYPTLAKAPGF